MGNPGNLPTLPQGEVLRLREDTNDNTVNIKQKKFAGSVKLKKSVINESENTQETGNELRVTRTFGICCKKCKLKIVTFSCHLLKLCS
jgi:hypothetical protein